MSVCAGPIFPVNRHDKKKDNMMSIDSEYGTRDGSYRSSSITTVSGVMETMSDNDAVTRPSVPYFQYKIIDAIKRQESMRHLLFYIGNRDGQDGQSLLMLLPFPLLSYQ